MDQRSRFLVLARDAFCASAILFGGLAQADVVVVASAKSPAASLSKEQASDIFLGKVTNLTPLDQPETSPLRDEFYSKVTGKSAAQAKSYWSKLSFTGKGVPPKEAQSSADIKKLLDGDASLVGYIERSAVDSSVKVLYSAQ